MNEKRKIGEVKPVAYLRICACDGQTEDGKEFECSVTMTRYEPLVTYNERTFHLSWNDIVYLAEQAGLFDAEAQA